MVISLVAATERQTLLDWIGSDIHLVQEIQLPFVSDRTGVTAIYPPDAEVAALFGALGTAVSCATRKENDLLATASVALMSIHFRVMEIAISWLAENGLTRSKA